MSVVDGLKKIIPEDVEKCYGDHLRERNMTNIAGRWIGDGIKGEGHGNENDCARTLQQWRCLKGNEVPKRNVVPNEVTEEVVTQQPEPDLRKGKRNRTPKNFGHEFQLYLIEETRDEVSDEHFYCFNVENDPKTFDEAMKSQDVAFYKEAINDEMNFILGNNTWVLADLPPE
ncbi:hypothetical protein Tco_0775633 [Tanacetum coccineum]